MVGPKERLSEEAYEKCALCGTTENVGYLGYFDNDDGSQNEVDLCAKCYHDDDKS